jgi:hypothetical protein
VLLLDASLVGAGVVPKKCSQNRIVVELDSAPVSPSGGGGRIDVVFCLLAVFAELIVLFCLLPIAAGALGGACRLEEAVDDDIDAALFPIELPFDVLALLSIYVVLLEAAADVFFLVYFFGGVSSPLASSLSPRLLFDPIKSRRPESADGLGTVSFRLYNVFSSLFFDLSASSSSCACSLYL